MQEWKVFFKKKNRPKNGAAQKKGEKVSPQR